jgi:hypothetical protein
MRQSLVLAVLLMAGTAELTMGEDEKKPLPSLAAPAALDDDWARWLVGEWESEAESDNGPFKNWVSARGRLTVELGIGGQFIIMHRQGLVTGISDEYERYLKQTMHASETDVEKVRHLPLANLELQTMDPKTGAIIAYLFDSWRCVAKGTGTREGNAETIRWEWSAAGQGTSVRVTKKLDNDKFVITENYSLPNGATMEDRIVVTRKNSASRFE